VGGWEVGLRVARRETSAICPGRFVDSTAWRSPDKCRGSPRTRTSRRRDRPRVNACLPLSISES